MANMIQYDRVKKFLEKYDYTVKVIKVDDNACQATFPVAKTHSEKEFVSYKLRRQEEYGIYVNEEFWSAPEYSLRLMISCDILNRMRQIPIHDSLISYYIAED